MLDDLRRGPAHQALARILAAAFRDDRDAERILAAAMQNAGIKAIPATARGLLPVLELQIIPLLVHTVDKSLLEDLREEVVEEAQAEARTGLAKPTEPAPSDGALDVDLDWDAPESPSPSGDDVHSLPTVVPAARRKPPIAQLAPQSVVQTREVRPEKSELPAFPKPASLPRLPLMPLTVLLHLRDRLARSALARGLVSARCEVSIVDDMAEVAQRIRDSVEIQAVVLDFDDPAAGSFLPEIAAFGHIVVGCWSQRDRVVTEPILLAHHWPNVRLIEPRSRPADVAALLRLLRTEAGLFG